MAQREEAQRRREEAEAKLRAIEERKAWEEQQKREEMELRRAKRAAEEQQQQLIRSQLQHEAHHERVRSETVRNQTQAQKKAEREAWEASVHREPSRPPAVSSARGARPRSGSGRIESTSIRCRRGSGRWCCENGHKRRSSSRLYITPLQ